MKVHVKMSECCFARPDPVRAVREQAFKLGQLDLGEPFLTPVHNFEVEDFHTYYVGEVGVWVHNSGCKEAEALEAVSKKADLEGSCFVAETKILIENGEWWVDKYVRSIEFIEVGDKVLSRCEHTGETAYKRVTKVFERGCASVSVIACTYDPAYYAKFGHGQPAILATSEHPFWVLDKGWTVVGELQPGDELLTVSGEKATVEQIHRDAYRETVYNLEVEDFHTYFVDAAGFWVHNCNHKIEVNRLNASVVVEPKPEWSPIQKSTAELDTPNSGLSAKQIEVAKNEMRIDKTLNQADMKTLALTDNPTTVIQNGLGRYDPLTKRVVGNPDRARKWGQVLVAAWQCRSISKQIGSGLVIKQFVL